MLLISFSASFTTVTNKRGKFVLKTDVIFDPASVKSEIVRPQREFLYAKPDSPPPAAANPLYRERRLPQRIHG